MGEKKENIKYSNHLFPSYEKLVKSFYLTDNNGMKKKYAFLAGLVVAGMILSGCASSRARNLIAIGDEVSAIEVLAGQLTRKYNDHDSAVLFASVYPSAVEERLSISTVKEVKQKYLSSYSSDLNKAVKLCLAEVREGQTPSSHPAIASVIREGERVVRTAGELVRIQRAVQPMPSVVGNEKKGSLYQVYKYSDNFQVLYDNACREMAELYFALAESCFPGKTIAQKKELLTYYEKAKSYNYAGMNVQNRIYQLCYEIAMLLKKDARSEKDFLEVLSYLNKAGDYADTAHQIIDTKYQLAVMYRADHNRASYEKAGKLFTEVGNYEDAPQEASLYAFYCKLKSLTKNYTYGNVNLYSGSEVKPCVSRSITPMDKDRAVLELTSKTSILGSYTTAGAQLIFPGAIFEPQTIPEQRFTLFTAGLRQPVNFSLSSNGLALNKGTITNTAQGSRSLGEVQSLAKQNVRGIQPVCTYEFEKVYSPEDIRISTGMGYDRYRVMFANENSTWKKDKSYTLVKVTQAFYTADLETPVLPVDFFAAGKGKGIITEAALGKVSPYYVSSVDYGRKAYFLVSSNLSTEQIIQDIKYYRPRDSRNSGAQGLRVNPEVSRSWDKNNTVVSSITVSEKLYSIVDIDGIYQWIKTGVDMGVEISDLVPVSFKLRNLYDNSFAILSESQTAVIANPNPETEPAKNNAVVTGGTAATGNGSSGTGAGTTGGNTGSGSAGNTGSMSGSGTGSGSTGTGSSGNAGSGNSAGAVPGTGTITGAGTVTGNEYTSLVFVGKYGTYNCAVITSGDEWIYYVPENDILNCKFNWSDSEYSKVYVNGISITKNQTVYSFRDVIGNNISLDMVDVNGNRSHHLLKVLKK